MSTTKISTYNYVYPTGLAPIPEDEVEGLEFDFQTVACLNHLTSLSASLFRNSPNQVSRQNANTGE